MEGLAIDLILSTMTACALVSVYVREKDDFVSATASVVVCETRQSTAG